MRDLRLLDLEIYRRRDMALPGLLDSPSLLRPCSEGSVRCKARRQRLLAHHAAKAKVDRGRDLSAGRLSLPADNSTIYWPSLGW